mgnify:CR=1 FL=1
MLFRSTRLHADGQIDANKIVLDRAANQSIILKQNGVTTLELWSGGAITCQKVKVTDYDEDDLVVPKSYVDSEIAANVGGSSGPAALGRPFKLEPSPGDNAFRLDAGRFQMATTGNVAWTATLSDVAYLSFCYEDLDGIVWRMQSQGLYGFPTNFIQIYSSDRMIGWWLYESWDAGFNFADYSTLGGVTIPVKSWNSTGNTTTLPANGEFRLHSPVWG